MKHKQRDKQANKQINRLKWNGINFGFLRKQIAVFGKTFVLNFCFFFFHEAWTVWVRLVFKEDIIIHENNCLYRFKLNSEANNMMCLSIEHEVMNCNHCSWNYNGAATIDGNENENRRCKYQTEYRLMIRNTNSLSSLKWDHILLKSVSPVFAISF